uniref:ATP-dependent RNA helicase n=1 Tax=Haemonchus contortus TaxID=6289 RepID=A0A7I4XXU3_HAECO
MTTRSIIRVCRRFATSRSAVKLNSNVFGSLHRSDIPIERLIRPKNLDFDSAVPARRVKELSVPVALSRKKREQLEKLQSKEDPPPGHKCFIECSRPEFNLLEAKPGLHTPLCSQFWDKCKYKDYWFVIRRKTKESPSQFVQWENAWDHFVPDRLDPSVRETLGDLKLKTPTQIQTQCLQVFPSHYHLFIAAETGSGKTIAYLAPLITRLLKQKRKSVKERAVILAVTSLLKEQIFSVISKFVPKTGIVVSMCGSKENTADDWDILVGTPGLVQKYFQNNKNCSADVKHLILEEADMILDDSFTEVLTEIFALVPVAHSITNTSDVTSGARIIFCSATCAEEVEGLADGVVDRQFLRFIKSPRLHSLLPNIEMKFIRVREKDKIARLTELLTEDMKRGNLNQTMVFCKDRATASYVHQQLQSFEYKVRMWNSLDDADEEESARVIIATDAASRGIDLPRLSHVINYDLSAHSVDFLHRAGRIGRLSSSFLGRVTSFVRRPYEVRLTNAIELAARLGRPLSAVRPEVFSEASRDAEAATE